MIPEELGKDAKSVAALQRRHANFEHDLVTLGTQVWFSTCNIGSFRSQWYVFTDMPD